VFTYSREEDTAAYDLSPQLPERVKRERRVRLMELQAEISLGKNRDLVGHELEVMVEEAMPGRVTRSRGRTPGQAPEIDGMVLLKGQAQPGEFVRARIVKAFSYDLAGEVADATA